MKYATRSRTKANANERGSALIPAMMVVAMLAVLGLSMLTAGLNGSRVVTGQSEEYKVDSAVESVGALTAEHVWSGYLRSQGGSAGTIDTFRAYLTSVGVANSTAPGTPVVGQGHDFLGAVTLPGSGTDAFDGVEVQGLNVVRQDDGDATRLYVTVSAKSKRGKGLVEQPVARAVQLVYTVAPAQFEGFEYGILTKNVNCVFCHTVIDSAERAYNHDPSLVGTFEKVKVGSLESLMLRTDARPGIGDWDADTLIAGSLYVRGDATNQNGVPISNWGGHMSFRSAQFDADGNLVQNSTGGLTTTTFQPAGNPPQPGENLYLNYPTTYADMPDGKLPQEFPPPFPDDGGIDPSTGLASTTGAGNKHVDPNEFYAATQTAEGTISGGILTQLDGSDPIDSPAEITGAFQTGNVPSLPSVSSGHVVMTGTLENPIQIDGTVAIDGDVIITGYVKGTGVILASGNIYVPTDLRYLDGHSYQDGDDPGHPTGPVTFGVAQDGTHNALGLACGGNMLMGDFLASSNNDGDGHEYVTGSSDGPFNFSLAEITLFNRTEWAHTQPLLPGYGQDTSDPSTWTVPNPSYIAGYVPRYYQFGPDDEIPIYNKGHVYFDPTTGTWKGDSEVPLTWNEEQLTLLDPNDTQDPRLYDPVTGQMLATLLNLTPEGGWITDEHLQDVIETLTAQHTANTPLQVDGLLYTNNAIFGVVPRASRYAGQMVVNGSLVCADLGLLAPGRPIGSNVGANGTGVLNSTYSVGLRLNYDKRTKSMIHVKNPYSVTIQRTLWNPVANLQ